jgi:hypothetical protein
VSYAYNYQALAGTGVDPWAGAQTFDRGYADGLSNTQMWAEKSGQCNNGTANVTNVTAPKANIWSHSTRSGVGYMNIYAYESPWNTLTFQQQTTLQDCDWRMPHAFAQSLQVCLMDGSVRSVATGISQATWNASITPRSADQLGADW